MADLPNELERIAEADGAVFTRSATGAWWARDKDGITIVRGALSRAEAAVLYCEDRDLCGSTPEAILARIRFEYRPYDTLPAFDEGFASWAARPRQWHNPHGGGYEAQAGQGSGRCLAVRPGVRLHRDAPGHGREGRPGLAGHAAPDGEVLTWQPRCHRRSCAF
jgi:hypothetical protein